MTNINDLKINKHKKFIFLHNLILYEFGIWGKFVLKYVFLFVCFGG